MVPFLAMLALGSPPVDQGELNRRVVAESERLLEVFGVPEPYVVKSVGAIVDPDGSSTTTACRIAAQKGGPYFGAIRNDSGRLVDFGDERAYSRGVKTREPGSRTPKIQRARARFVVARLALPFPVQSIEDPDPAFAWKYTEDRFTIPITIGGHPFLDPRLGYSLTLDAKTGEVVRYSASDDVPPIQDAKSWFKKADALAAARRLLVSEPRQTIVGGQMKAWVAFTVAPKGAPRIQLVWFLPSGEPKARLAWVVPYVATLHETSGSGSVLSRLVFDATTGTRIVETGYPLGTMLNLDQQESLSKARARLDAIRGHL